MSSKILIDANTAAITTGSFSVKFENIKTAIAYGLADSEEIVIEGEYSDGNFTPLYGYDEEPLVITSTRNVFIFDAPGTYRLVKPETASAVTVNLSSTRDVI